MRLGLIPASELYWLQRPPTHSECYKTEAPNCDALFVPGVIVAPADASPFLLTHEACHEVQFAQRKRWFGPKAEAECNRVGRLAAAQALATP